MKKFFISMMMLCMAAVGMQAQDTWTVVGSNAICGTEWNLNDDSNNMTQNAVGIWELVKTECVLKQGAEYKFKVVKNHSWDEAYPSSDYILRVDETATYTVTVQFDESTKAVTASTEKTGAAVIGEEVWTVAGDEALMGSSWKPEDETNDMTKQEDGTYQLVKNGRTLAANTEYKYKVCADHGWSEAYGENGGDAKLTVPEDGVYNVTFTFNPETKAVGASVEKTGSAEIEKTWTVAGDEALTGSDWKPENEENDMMLMDDGTYKFVFYSVEMDASKEYPFKICANHAWSESYGQPNENGGYDNYVITVKDDGIYDVSITFNPDTKEITVDTEMVEPIFIEKIWTVAGDEALTGCDWKPEAEENDMQKQNDGTYMLVFADRQLSQDTEYQFKVCANHGWIQSYGTPYDDGTHGNYVMVVPADGTYNVTITFDPVTKAVAAIAQLAGSDTTGFIDVNHETLTNNCYYDLQGRRVAAQQRGLYIINGKKIIK